MGAIVGQRQTRETGHNVEALPKIRNRFRFLYMSHPLRWFWDPDDVASGGDGWLPELSRMQITPGLNGTYVNEQRREVIDRTILGHQNLEWSVIRDDDKRLGEFCNYLVKFPTAGKASVWGTIFDSVRVVGGSPRWRFDAARYRDFLRHLVDSGIVSGIDESVRESKIDDARTMLDRMEGRLAQGAFNQALATRIEAMRQKLAGMQGSPAAPPPALPQRPTRTRAPKTAAAAVP